MDWKEQFDEQFIYDDNFEGLVYNNGEGNSTDYVSDKAIKGFIQLEIIEKLIRDAGDYYHGNDTNSTSEFKHQLEEQLRNKWL